jgi:hypothetical protein
MDKSNTQNLLKAALDYWQRGWSIIPVGYDKKPPSKFKWGVYMKRLPSKMELYASFSSGKHTSLAVVCGAVSGNLCVLDLDSAERCSWWQQTHSELAKTLPTAKTKKGLHIYFLVAKTFRKQNGDQVDLLCDGAYVILPPSPDKEWLIPLNGELPVLDPFEWGLEQFGIQGVEEGPHLTEDTDDTEAPEEPEEIEDIERNRNHKALFVELFSINVKNGIEKAIENTLPKQEGERNRAVFIFCQWLKAMPELRDLPAKDLKPIVLDWHNRASPVVGTKSFSVTWADFIHAWKRVKWPKGEPVLDHAIQRALEDKLNPPESVEYDKPEVQLLLRVCYQLQQGMGEQPFFLAVRKAGQIIGLSHTEAGKYLEMFVEDGRLDIVEQYTTRKANRFRYISR